MPARPDRPHVLTVALEDYFQVGAFRRFVRREQWYRFETRLEHNVLQTLALLDRYDAKATFFVLGWVARRYPGLVRLVADAGHEVASNGYYHRGARDLSPGEFRDDALRAKEAVERASGRAVLGYRLADGWLRPADLWALDELAAAGFAYDSSLAPMGRDFAGQPARRFAHRHEAGKRSIWELPVSTGGALGYRMPVAGGNYLRQLPLWATRRAVAAWEAEGAGPLVAYFHVWELDAEQPRLSVGSRLTQARHYRNLDRMHGRVAALLAGRRFGTAAAYLGLDQPAREPSGESAADTGAHPRPAAPTRTLFPEPPTPVTVVVPCYNEAESLRYLANTLARVRDSLADRYEVRYVIVNDASTDGTAAGLGVYFRDFARCQVVHHERNSGVASAIASGLRRADTELCASIDCDCSYDPLKLAEMLPLLTPGVDIVTASPYHPRGEVRNVPAWRLALSRGAAWLYRRVLKHQLATYTSCFRVYRRSSVAGLPLRHGGFLGIAELLGRVDLAGGRIAECPATLEVRVLGRSKMKVARTVIGHVGLLLTLAKARLTGRWGRAHRDAVVRAVVSSHTAGSPVLFRAPRPADPGDVRRAVVNPTPARTP